VIKSISAIRFITSERCVMVVLRIILTLKYAFGEFGAHHQANFAESGAIGRAWTDRRESGRDYHQRD
jgi:hypothetical protein